MSRNEMYAYIRNNNLTNDVQKKFNKPYSSVSSDGLTAFIDEHKKKVSHANKKCDAKEDVVVEESNDIECEKQVSSLCEKYGSVRVFLGVLQNGLLNDLKAVPLILVSLHGVIGTMLGKKR